MYPGGQTPTRNESAVDRGTFLAVMRKAVSTVGVVTTDGPGGRFGLTISSMSSATIEPPAMLVCIHDVSGSPVVAAVERNRTFCVNLLGEGQVPISEVFPGRHPAANAHRFACAEWTTLVTGCPVLLSAAASLDCKIAGQHRFGSHVLFIGEVVAALMNESRVLVYHDRNYCQLGVRQ